MSILLFLSLVVTIGVVWFAVLGLKSVCGKPLWRAAGERGLVVATRRPQAEAGTESEAIAGVRFVEVPAKALWTDASYCWIVVCKNHWYHRHPNIFNVHRIPLGETDGVSPRPLLPGAFAVRCDACGKEYQYSSSAVLRCEMETKVGFEPHPLFREQFPYAW